MGFQNLSLNRRPPAAVAAVMQFLSKPFARRKAAVEI
jgi:hypothetical protein